MVSNLICILLAGKIQNSKEIVCILCVEAVSNPKLFFLTPISHKHVNLKILVGTKQDKGNCQCFAAAEHHHAAFVYFNLKSHFWVTSSAFIFCLFDLLVFCLTTVVLMPLHFIWVWFGSFQCVWLGFDSCIMFSSVYNAVFYCRAQLIVFAARCCIFYHGYLSFFFITAGCLLVIAPLCKCEVCCV